MAAVAKLIDQPWTGGVSRDSVRGLGQVRDGGTKTVSDDVAGVDRVDRSSRRREPLTRA